MEAAIGSEEIWNQKQLAKAVGTSVASARITGQARSLESIEASLRIAEGLRAKNLRDGLKAWLQQFHGADFSLETDEEGRTLVSLTDSGAEKYQVCSLCGSPRALRANPELAYNPARAAGA